ncbi:hypothetical protein ERS140159_00010 [Staphylococcus schweitzeri]|nr:hypothetical protein ERS140159_00010 [Staphylococcus schweitzeri]
MVQNDICHFNGLYNIIIVINYRNKKSLINMRLEIIFYNIGETNLANDSLNLTDSGLLAYDSLVSCFDFVISCS